MQTLFAVVVPVLTLLGLAGLNLWLRQRVRIDDTPLVDALDQVLPQTQCAQCGYPGCRPYASALAAGDVATNLCPPGGTVVAKQLAEILGTSADTAPEQTHTHIALINEADCIGCTLCLPPCPVDAIVGSNGYMHTVIAEHCTGCELCIPACPVDCISLVPKATPPAPPAIPETELSRCIRCGACNPVCPVHLPVQQLWDNISCERTEWALSAGLQQCIECGLCDDVCPSNLPLSETFGTSKLIQDQAASTHTEQMRMKDRYARHQARLHEQATTAEEKRSARLNRRRSWQ